MFRLNYWDRDYAYLILKTIFDNMNLNWSWKIVELKDFYDEIKDRERKRQAIYDAITKKDKKKHWVNAELMM